MLNEGSTFDNGGMLGGGGAPDSGKIFNNKSLGRGESAVIALETSGRAGSVAVSVDGGEVVERVFSGQMRHSVELFDVLKGVLGELGASAGDIGQIYVDNGPGSFTGIRIAVTAAKMVSYATGAKIAAVSSSDVLAMGTREFMGKKLAKVSQIGTILDAKRGKFFTSVFRNEPKKCTKIAGDQLMSAEEFVEKYAQKEIWLTGEGLVYYKELFKGENVRFVDEECFSARAKDVYELGSAKAKAGEFVSAESLTASYIRHSGAKVKKRS